MPEQVSPDSSATAHKLARIIYALLTQGQAYVDRGQADYERRYQQRVLSNLQRKALRLGFELQPLPESQAPSA